MRLCLQGDLKTFGQEYAVLSARTYLGLTVELFDNKYHKAQLFRCLFEPHPLSYTATIVY